jgi:hypothetical protein
MGRLQFSRDRQALCFIGINIFIGHFFLEDECDQIADGMTMQAIVP